MGDIILYGIIEGIQWVAYGLGGFLMWLVKGAKTSLKDEVNNNHKRNSALSLVIFAAMIYGFVLAVN